MSTDNPCCVPCDFTDDPDVTDLGCCSPSRIVRNCEAPVLPTPQCDEEGATVIYDEATEEFVVLNTLYDSNCSALLDSTSSPLLARVG